MATSYSLIHIFMGIYLSLPLPLKFGLILMNGMFMVPRAIMMEKHMHMEDAQIKAPQIEQVSKVTISPRKSVILDAAP